MTKPDRLNIKINDNLTIAAKDIRNIEVRFKVPADPKKPKSSLSKVGYTSNLKSAIMLCAREVPLYSQAKNLVQLKADYDDFIQKVEQIVDQYKLPDSQQLIGNSQESPLGLYGQNMRGEDSDFVVDAPDEFDETDDFSDEFDFDDDWS